MHFEVLDQEIPYTGKELRSGWVAARSGAAGEGEVVPEDGAVVPEDGAVGFVGRCTVENQDLVDLEDARAGTFIAAAKMAHVIAEHPCSLQTAVLRQRLLVAILCDCLAEFDIRVRRDGDDVYYDDRKLTVSIAAPSGRSSVIHLGINIDPEGAPVPAVGLEELGVEPRQLLMQLLERYAAELQSCRHAEGKVRRVP